MVDIPRTVHVLDRGLSRHLVLTYTIVFWTDNPGSACGDATPHMATCDLADPWIHLDDLLRLRSDRASHRLGHQPTSGQEWIHGQLPRHQPKRTADSTDRDQATLSTLVIHFALLLQIRPSIRDGLL
jgi:hypothetical protein